MEIKYEKNKNVFENDQTKDAILEDIKQNYFPVEAKAVVPTGKPKSFFEQFYLYESGATRRFYIYINGTWRYSALT